MSKIDIPSGISTQLCQIGFDVFDALPEVVRQLWTDKELIIVADETTWKVAGEQASSILRQEGFRCKKPFIFPAKPELHADYAHVQTLVPVLSNCNAIAVGSGTINDLVKRASSEAGCDGYLCLATAPSVDGYTSAGAALTVNGYKKTLPCPAPKAILADLNILAEAPMPMLAGGYADLAAKVTAGADWHIADLLQQHRIDRFAWNLVQKNLRQWLKAPEQLLQRDRQAVGNLFTGLAFTGFAMQYFLDSRPASGAEHLFSHIWEMQNLKYQGVSPSHGYKVGVGTLMATALMQETFAMPLPLLKQTMKNIPPMTATEREQQILTIFKGFSCLDEVRQVAMDKFLTGKALQQRRQMIFQNWPQMTRRVRRQLLSFRELKRRLETLDCPVQPGEIGVDRQQFSDAIWGAGMIRKRYTILDLLFELGLLPWAIEQLQQKGYFKFP